MASADRIVQRTESAGKAEEFRETGLAIVPGLFRASLGRAAADEVPELQLFSTPRRIDIANGQISTLHKGVSLQDTVLGIALHRVVSAGNLFRIDLHPSDKSGEADVQAIELSSKYTLGHARVGKNALALAVLDGELTVGFENSGQRQVIEAGSAAFIERGPEATNFVVHPHGHATGLLVAGTVLPPREISGQ